MDDNIKTVLNGIYDWIIALSKTLHQVPKENYEIKNCQEVNDLNERWWQEIIKGSSRDQLSLPYTLGKIATYKNLGSGSQGESIFFYKRDHLMI